MHSILKFTILLCFLVLSGCQQQPTELSKSELFEKKKECAGYKEEIMKEISDMNYSYSISTQELYLEGIFYSPKINSCIFHSRGTYTDAINDIEITRDKQELRDFFSKELLVTTPAFCTSYGEDKIPYMIGLCTDDYFDQRIQDFKGE